MPKILQFFGQKNEKHNKTMFFEQATSTFKNLLDIDLSKILNILEGSSRHVQQCL